MVHSSRDLVRCRDVAPVWIERGALVLPPPRVPLVCVGPGTGIAPFRSFLWERFAAVSAGHAVAPSVLVLGCRNKSKDFLYAEVRRRFFPSLAAHAAPSPPCQPTAMTLEGPPLNLRVPACGIG